MSPHEVAVSTFCPKCGRPAADDDSFCRACGRALAAESAPAPTDSFQPLPEKPKDKLLGVRIVLLLATILAAFTCPWFVALFFGVAWILALVFPEE